jgi:hypothetical protein
MRRLDAVLAEHPLLVGAHVPREHEEARLAEELAGAARDDASGALAALVDVYVVVLDLLFLVLERRFRGALLEQGIEGGFDVVGVQLLVEVEAFFVVVFVDGGRGVGRCGVVDGVEVFDLDEFVVEFEVVVLVEFLVEVFQLLDLFYYYVVVVEVVVAHRHVCRLVVWFMGVWGSSACTPGGDPGAEGAGV